MHSLIHPHLVHATIAGRLRNAEQAGIARRAGTPRHPTLTCRALAAVAAALVAFAGSTDVAGAYQDATATSVYRDSHYNLGTGSGAYSFQQLTGYRNAILGYFALTQGTSASDNVAVGFQALYSNTGGSDNIAVGSRALSSNGSMSANAAMGTDALRSLTNGASNLAVGNLALYYLQSGSDNVAMGRNALAYVNGNRNIAIGRDAGINVGSGSDNLYVGSRGVGGDSGKIRIGTQGQHTGAFLAGVDGAAIPGPTRAVMVNSAGQLGTATASSAALKRDIRSVGASDVLSLQPVSYRYKRGPARRQYGLIAEDVARKLPLLASYDAHGKPNGVYYEQLSVLLLAEMRRQGLAFKRQQREIDALRRLVLARR